MIILQVKDLTKTYGVQSIFQNISFALQDGEKVGLIGPNGTGKSTLLKCLTGEEIPDSGDIFISERISLGFLAQNNCWRENSSLFEELLLGFEEVLADRKLLRELEREMSSAVGTKLSDLMHRYAMVTERYEQSGGYGCENMVKRVAKGLGFTDEEFSQPITTMSGGQKTRAALARLLLKQPDVLLLDEPTNHLDLAAVEWLEEFIGTYPKTVLVVSHDRYFLDQTVTRILELTGGKINSFPENYCGYLRRKAEQEESCLRAYEKQQQVIARTEEFIRRYKAGVKSKQARGRETLLKRLERLEKPQQHRTLRSLNLGAVPESGFSVLEAVNLGHSYGEKKVFHDLSFSLTRGEKVALVGANGSGKSTVLKAVAGVIDPAEGQAKLGSRVKIGYFAQEQENLHGDRTVLQEIMFDFNKGEEETRNLLGSFLFSGDEVEKRVFELSGGERARLALLKLLLQEGNFLLLDEPTNHLDIPSKEVIENFLGDYFGTVLVVSHDRYFIDKVADRVLEIADGKITDFTGNYSYYRFKKKELDQSVDDTSESKLDKQRSCSNISYLREQEKILKKLERQINETEAELETLEEEKESIARRMSDPQYYEDGEEIKLLVERFQKTESAISLLYSQWEILMEKQEKTKEQVQALGLEKV